MARFHRAHADEHHQIRYMCSLKEEAARCDVVIHFYPGVTGSCVYKPLRLRYTEINLFVFLLFAQDNIQSTCRC
jgi:hypothetical protein